MIEGLCDKWDGPISVAVFGDWNELENILWNMTRIVYCNKCKKLNMQLVLPNNDHNLSGMNIINKLNVSFTSFSCRQTVVVREMKKKNYQHLHPYPVNFLRNLAKSQSVTDYILTIDIDMLPSENLRNDFLKSKLVEKYQWNDVVFVVPIFEIEHDVQMPQSKNDLLECVKMGKARPFYLEPCEKCQSLTNYTEWLKNNKTSGIEILYEVEWKYPWEPFFISNKKVPNFDERFKQYGMNRVSQICELYVAGYKFKIISNGFLIHDGYKRKNEFHEMKNLDMTSNRKIYNRFKYELKLKYFNSTRKC
ncbi:N-acetyllactosaminide beta-1,3-N-acetylglucosaminyltransferase, putative [Pediculus humanus corporis]|uniref:Beta-1,4-glucuronyltransferase 1 n=1 Tax=Pediculus humanus subsp. corporis TaxID=121224 RepID=E0VLE2_PEDHC|nr:N-acetyllactosaminide beta-1,3-N-acetylglucosaminyltransferase, putative [Pediculus humanus corporis]EEB14198.1 N-acetyllactosaminide beta-1,3-N-acetylglucosaminyltransferase, putative [Pediculus humanus corporis]